MQPPWHPSVLHMGTLSVPLPLHCLFSPYCAHVKWWFPFLLKPSERTAGWQAPGICEGWKRRRNKLVFVEWKLCPFVPLPKVPHDSPSGLDCPWGWAGVEAGAHKAAGDTALGRALYHWSLPHPTHPIPKPHPSGTPWRGEVLLLTVSHHRPNPSTNKSFPRNTHLLHLANRSRSVGSPDQGGTLCLPLSSSGQAPYFPGSQYILNSSSF